MRIVIMCQGQQRRLADLGHPKHLLKVGDQTILGRTVSMLFHVDQALRQAGRETALDIVGPPELGSAVGHASHPMIGRGPLDRESPGNCIVDGLLATRKLWANDVHGRTVILLGDVVWSRRALAAVLSDPRPIVFAGTSALSASQGEVFALAFDNSQAVVKLCETCPCRVDGTRKRTFPRMLGGHLRRLLWWTQAQHHKIPPNRSKQTWHPDLYLPIDDWTMDIDDPADVARLPELARLIELEERDLGEPTESILSVRSAS